MPRKRDPKRDEAFRLYQKYGGNIPQKTFSPINKPDPDQDHCYMAVLYFNCDIISSSFSIGTSIPENNALAFSKSDAQVERAIKRSLSEYSISVYCTLLSLMYDSHSLLSVGILYALWNALTTASA